MRFAPIGDRLTSLQRLRTINAISDDILSPIVHRIDGRGAAVDVQAIEAPTSPSRRLPALAQLGDNELEAFAAHFSHSSLTRLTMLPRDVGSIRNAFGSKPAIYFTASRSASTSNG
ncbi:hypothetical protein [Xanthomonas oryzae]|uniref:hypothetical protein n=1 Tax=Xanthomonas oryzae TaxID=347 RepID=UPI0013157737|nr:hypothetical protein [Xanthomonas oryzae]